MLYKNTNGIPRETVMHIAQRLHESGFNQAKVASILGCSQPTVSTWLKEVRYQPHQVEHEVVEKLANALIQEQK